MRGQTGIVLVSAVLALAVSACQAGGGSEPPVEGGVLLSDDFSTAEWGTGTDADSSIEYADGTLRMVVTRQNHFVWSRPNNDEYENIHMEVTVLNNGTDSTTAFGLICNREGGDFYYFGITPAGQYAIALASDGVADTFLTNDDAWDDSSLIPVNAESYRVGADCGRGILNLYVNGQVIASALDDTYLRGQVAVFAWSDVDAVTTDVAFDDFVMTQLP